jgi:hypothetical protein
VKAILIKQPGNSLVFFDPSKVSFVKIFPLLICTLTLPLLILFEIQAQENNSYLDPPRILTDPESSEGYAASCRRFTGIPSLAITGRDRIWATWYTGVTPAEDSNNYVVVATSGDGGLTWAEVLAIDPDGRGPARSYDPNIWIDPFGKLWVFWAQAMAHK